MANSLVVENIKCPHCGHNNKAQICLDKMGRNGYFPDFFITCDVESGGCDSQFVARATITAIVRTAEIGEFS